MPRKKDNVDLVCDIAELSNLFERSSKLVDFLNQAVELIAWHMKAAVCSIYLYNEERDELVLKANQGLNSEAVGMLSLKTSEGLTGLAFRELRPVCEGRGTKHPLYKNISGIHEEKYEAFLAAPITRGLNRIGVIVLQDPQAHYFNERDVKALKAIAAQLASTIQNAELFLNLEEADAKELNKGEDTQVLLYKGCAVSQGITHGTAIPITSKVDFLEKVEKSPGFGTLADYEQSLGKTEKQLNEMQRSLERDHSDIASMIFSAHLLMLQDSSFSGKIAKRIDEQTPASEAVMSVVNEYTKIFSRSKNPLLREKTQDVQDLGHRLIENMMPQDQQHPDYDGNIVITEELMPSDIVKLTAQRVEGILLIGGNPTSHVSILLKSFQIPVLLLNERSLLNLEKGTPILLDATNETVYVNPSDEVLKTFKETLEMEKAIFMNGELDPPEHKTHDGIPFSLLSNVNLISDVDVALRVHAEGVGLYRTEFPFLIRNNFPTEEEQYGIYSDLIERVGDREVVFRTLDIGGDKIMTYFPTQNESNPFLGLRAIRFSLQNIEIFSQQLRALLRAGADTKLKIMFPMVSSVDDFIQAREVVNNCIEQLKNAGVQHNNEPILGVMIETPSAVELVGDIANECDFLCIGTNDLIQYLLAVDRTNEHISHLYLNHHPAVLRALNRITKTILKSGKEISICGELVQDLKMLPFLLGIGIRKFSVDSRAIPKVRSVLTSLSLTESERISQEMLKLCQVDQIEAYLNKMDHVERGAA